MSSFHINHLHNLNIWSSLRSANCKNSKEKCLKYLKTWMDKDNEVVCSVLLSTKLLNCSDSKLQQNQQYKSQEVLTYYRVFIVTPRCESILSDINCQVAQLDLKIFSI